MLTLINFSNMKDRCNKHIKYIKAHSQNIDIIFTLLTTREEAKEKEKQSLQQRRDDVVKAPHREAVVAVEDEGDDGAGRLIE